MATVRARLLAFTTDAGNVLFAWLLFVLAEGVVVDVWRGPEFSAAWERTLAHEWVMPIALGALVPCAFFAAALGQLAGRAKDAGHARPARAVLALVVAVAAGALGYGVSSGRHMASWGVRGPFVLALAATGAALGGWLVPRLVRGTWDRRWAGPVGAAAAVGFWCADVGILPRLYPAFHDGLLVLMLASAAFASMGWSARERERDRGRGATVLGLATLVGGAVCAMKLPAAAQRLRGADNLRIILTEHAPLLGRAVRLAAALAPPPAIDEVEPGHDSPTRPDAIGDIPRALDWTGHDVLLLSVDALRADHVSAYGYTRPTTPSIDALAAEGALFQSAYCPTPHTSYSITSMMTGKAMRPLLSQGLGRDSETWAGALRRYGFKTAAFYPPAVFFIDEDRFGDFESSGLGFEYRKVEFAPARMRGEQVAEYLKSAPASAGAPLFLWVHLFEPHEPYEAHADHPFGPLPIDAYDSEIAEADDAVGGIARRFRAARPGAVIIVTADHGEEFGEHGGHYHGTSCYEEQVHVPLVVVGPGVGGGPLRIRTVVQTIDLLPTVLSALGIPRPARVRGRDLGPLMARAGVADGLDRAGVAYAETDEYTLLARGDDRLVCARKIAACTLFDVARDPGEQRDASKDAAATVATLRAMTAASERDQGRFEGVGDGAWPAALRRGLQGDREAALDVATLLDDASVTIRRKAAEVLFRLHADAVAPSVRRALARDEDPEVRSWCALALVRMGDPPPAAAAALASDVSRPWRRRAALAFAERGDARGAAELAAWWADEAPPRPGLDLEAAKELLVAMARIRDTEAVPALVTSLTFVPLRPWIADALGAIGDARARAPLLQAFRDERSVTARPREAGALVRLDVRAELGAPLARFAGIAEPMPEAIAIARDAHVLRPQTGGVAVTEAHGRDALAASLVVPTGEPLRLLVLTAGPGTLVTGSVGGSALAAGEATLGAVHVIELAPSPTRTLTVELHVHAGSGLLAAWVVPRAADVPPPAPVPFDAGTRAPAPDDAGRPSPLN